MEQGSILDSDYVKVLEQQADVVYFWGVLHHTGDMWTAVRNAVSLVKPDGYLFIALYNDQGRASKFWKIIKKMYCALPGFLRWIVVIPCAIRLRGPSIVRDFIMLHPFQTWRNYQKDRGMSPWIDVIDWVGGYPFEVCKPEEIFHKIHPSGFQLENLKTSGGGRRCNEFVFKKLSNLNNS